MYIKCETNLDPYYAPRIVQAGWGIIITSCIQLIASACSVYICMRIIYNSDTSPTPAVISYFFLQSITSAFSQAYFYSIDVKSLPV